MNTRKNPNTRSEHSECHLQFYFIFYFMLNFRRKQVEAENTKSHISSEGQGFVLLSATLMSVLITYTPFAGVNKMCHWWLSQVYGFLFWCFKVQINRRGGFYQQTVCLPTLLSSSRSSSSSSLSFFLHKCLSLSLSAAGPEVRGLSGGWRQKKTNNFSGHRM